MSAAAFAVNECKTTVLSHQHLRPATHIHDTHSTVLFRDRPTHCAAATLNGLRANLLRSRAPQRRQQLQPVRAVQKNHLQRAKPIGFKPARLNEFWCK
jgi:hypothetical protein